MFHVKHKGDKMSLITPVPQSTSIKLYKGVVWDANYSNVRWFSSQTERTAYLTPLLIGQWSNCSVVSPGKSIKVEVPETFNTACLGNYMTFQNGNMGTPSIEWCAFVTGIDYVNVNTIQINYEIDWIQSFLWSFVFEQCNVEREHVNNDTFGLHTVEEGIDGGEYCIHNVSDHTYEKAMRLLSLSQAASSVTLSRQRGVVSGVEYRSSNFNGDLSYIETALSQLNTNGEANEVVDFCMCASPMINNVNGMHESFNVQNDGKVFSFGTTSYTAVNNKMQCYPFKFMTIDNYEGSVEQYRYENFTGNTYSFAIEGTDLPKPCMECFPINYQGWLGNSESPNTVQQMSVMFTNFPEIPWTSDTFRAWVSQNSATLVGSAISKVVKAGAGTAMLATGNVAGVGLLASAVIDAGAQSQEIQTRKIHSQELQGSIPSAGMSYFRDTIGFRATQYCIRPEMAKKIDKFFTRYGYKVNEVKIPNITGRQYVNFVKCTDANVGGVIPNDAKLAMERALINGISFWHVNNIGGDLSTNPIV